MSKTAIGLVLLFAFVSIIFAVFWQSGTNPQKGNEPVQDQQVVTNTKFHLSDALVERATLSDPDYPKVARQVDLLFNSGMTDRYAITNFQAQFPGWLVLMRKGDLKAAKSIWAAALKCSRKGIAPFSQESFRDMKADEERFAKEANRQPSKRRLLEISALYVTCGNVSEEQRIASLEALKLLAESGDWAARSDFIQHGRPDVSRRSANQASTELHQYRHKAQEYLREEIDKGRVEALLLASAVQAVNDYTTERSVLDYDPIKALAYHLAATNVLKERLKKSPPVNAQERAALESKVAAMERDGASISMFLGPGQQPFTTEQLKEATKLALEIEEQCCS